MPATTYLTDLINIASALGSSGQTFLDSVEDYLSRIESGKTVIFLAISICSTTINSVVSAQHLSIGNPLALQEVTVTLDVRATIMHVSVQDGLTLHRHHSSKFYAGARRLATLLHEQYGVHGSYDVSEVFALAPTPSEMQDQRIEESAHMDEPALSTGRAVSSSSRETCYSLPATRPSPSARSPMPHNDSPRKD